MCGSYALNSKRKDGNEYCWAIDKVMKEIKKVERAIIFMTKNFNKVTQSGSKKK